MPSRVGEVFDWRICRRNGRSNSALRGPLSASVGMTADVKPRAFGVGRPGAGA